jgi:Alpha-kinase family
VATKAGTIIILSTARVDEKGDIMASRTCASCDRCLMKASYSDYQWGKESGICNACVVDASQTARLNKSSIATFTKKDLEHPFAEGAFRWVAKGTHSNGPRRGEPCVCKWFKTGHVMESHFYDSDLKTSNEAIRLITKWNETKLVNRMIKVNLPEVWTFESNRRKNLQEPFIENYQKFNSNSGWADDSIPWARVMQALSHYSYHVSGGATLLCDLQGGVYKDGVVLTDPVIMSNTRQYGPTDLGPRGISSFFSSHVCSEYCRKDWCRPSDRTRYYSRTAHTSMEHHVPTRQSRSKMSMGSTFK